MWKTWAMVAAVVAILGAVWVLGAPKATGGGALASHRATYELKLGKASQRSTVNGVRGRLVVEWQDSCEGFTTNQRLFTEFLTEEGGATVSDIWLSSWESRDGARFRFTLTSLNNGNVDEKVRGEARRGPMKSAPAEKPGAQTAVAGGEALYSEPAGSHLPLPVGVVFPTGHTQALIEAARAGTHVLDRPVFDGSLKDGISQVSAFIGTPIEHAPDADAKKLKAAGKLLSGRSWPVRLAFFSPEKADSTPDYEFSYRMYENGVASGLSFDYGDFVVTGTLTELATLPGCDAPSPAPAPATP